MTGNIFIYKDYSPDKLSSYHHSEPYNKNKIYINHIADYGYGMKTYMYYIVHFNNNEKYVIVKPNIIIEKSEKNISPIGFILGNAGLIAFGIWFFDSPYCCSW